MNIEKKRVNKLTSKELNLILFHANTVKPTLQDYYENLVDMSQFTWKKLSFLIRNTTFDTKTRIFQCEFLH